MLDRDRNDLVKWFLIFNSPTFIGWEFLFVCFDWHLEGKADLKHISLITGEVIMTPLLDSSLICFQMILILPALVSPGRSRNTRLIFFLISICLRDIYHKEVMFRVESQSPTFPCFLAYFVAKHVDWMPFLSWWVCRWVVATLSLSPWWENGVGQMWCHSDATRF